MNHFIQYPDGRRSKDISVDGSGSIHLVPGSFNPLHAGHRRIFEYAKKISSCVYYEISTRRVGKEVLSSDEIEKRLEQFAWYAPIIVTDVPLFKEKIALGCFKNFRNIYIHCGEDTARRFADMNKPEEFDSRFHMFVYERFVDGELKQLDKSWAWPNMIAVNDWGREVAHISSSEIRRTHVK